MMTSETRPPSTPARSSAALMATCRGRGPEVVANAPLKAPTGVRAALTMTTSSKEGEDFLVYDAKTGDDITRSVLAQIIFEQENKAGQNLLPTTFLRQLIRFYGDSMQMVVPKYLEQSIDTLTHAAALIGILRSRDGFHSAIHCSSR
jgi:polyhydroxyalkanoate synthesis repressor PhaR